MSRIVVCVRTATLSKPHVPSAISSCNDCGQSVWLDRAHQMEDGDTLVCTTCLPQRAKVWQEVLDGEFQVTPSWPPEVEERGREVISMWKSMAEEFLSAVGRKGPPS